MQLQTAADFQSHSSKWNYQNNPIYIKEAEFGHITWVGFLFGGFFLFFPPHMLPISTRSSSPQENLLTF